jgi:maleate isomerase
MPLRAKEIETEVMVGSIMLGFVENKRRISDKMDSFNNTKWPLGWKAKIGLILPSQEEGQTSYEYRSMCPEGVITLETRVMGCSNITMDMLTRMREDAVYGAELLAVSKPDVITYEPTAASFILGVKGDQDFINEVQDKTGIKATTGASAVSAALKCLGIQKVLLCARTTEEITIKEVNYLEEVGLKIGHHYSFGEEESNASLKRITPWELYNKLVKIYKQCTNIEGILVTGGAYRTVEMLDTLEKDIGVPVVTTVAANMWRCLQLAGVKDPINGFGQLLARAR